MQARWVLVFVVLVLAATGCASNKNAPIRASVGEIQASEPTGSLTTGTAAPYYVEFRARLSAISGHTYLVYGPLDATGAPSEEIIMGFWPVGGMFGLLAGAVAFPGKVERAYLDEKLPDTNRFRRNLTAEQYAQLQAYVARAQKEKHVWSLFINNCNDFAAEAAEAIGLKVPPARFVPSSIFVLTLSSMNS